LTSKLLTLNPEYYTIWNHRRQILAKGLFPNHLPPGTETEGSDATAENDEQSSCLALIRSDLAFLVPLLRKFPKCYWIWNYRTWLLEQSIRLLSRQASRQLWQEELALVGKMLALDNRNFHGWGYRRTVVAQLESQSLSLPQALEGRTSMAEEEFAYTTRMIGTNLSNFSAWHHRTKLIPRLLNERGASGTARITFIEDGIFFSTSFFYLCRRWKGWIG
jgi:geranylgeranyl transferase type-2 subunit alpha